MNKCGEINKWKEYFDMKFYGRECTIAYLKTSDLIQNIGNITQKSTSTQN